jgi:hypothetical protein
MGKISTALLLDAAYGPRLFTKEMFYLVVGCALLLAIDWLKDRVFLYTSPEKT